ncbi:TPA: hypothetical protein ACRN1C_006351, partial [Pseudomonas aeruginosa]
TGKCLAGPENNTGNYSAGLAVTGLAYTGNSIEKNLSAMTPSRENRKMAGIFWSWILRLA